MTSPALAPLPNSSNAQAFERLLRMAAVYSSLEHFRRQSPKGVLTVGHPEIGQAAGNIWKVLSAEGPLTFAELMTRVDVPESLFFMAVGWLARESKVTFDPAGGDYLVRIP